MTTRTLTLLFSDVVGSTELLSKLGDREERQLRRDHFAALRQALEQNGGREIKNLGDGLMVSFESAQDALRCAIAMQRESARPTRGAQLSIRIGLSSGDVSIDEGDCFGTPVVEASRLCERASGGQVLLAESTRLLAPGYGPIAEIGDLELKGLPEPTKVWEAHWSPDNSPPVRAVLADDAVLVREGVAQVLEAAGIEVVGQAGDGEELIRLTSQLRPDLAVVDVRMPPSYTLEGVEAAERIRSQYPGTAVLVLTMDLDRRSASRLLAAGQTGVGYLLKERVTDVRQFTEAARRVAAGGTVFEPSVGTLRPGGWAQPAGAPERASLRGVVAR
jgi:class 3 adenylate cyclase